MIVKMQRPLASNDPYPKVLIYTEDRRFEIMLPLEEEWRRFFQVYGKVKLFAEAHMDKDMGFVVERVIGTDLGW